MASKMLKGFNNLHYVPLTANTPAAYTPGTAVALSGAQSVTQTETRNELKVNADDGTALQESEFQEGELQITVAGMKLDDLAALTGATIETDVMTEGELDNAPDVALTFSGLLAKGEGYRCFQYFVCNLTSWKNDLTTRGQNNDISAITLTFKYRGREVDHKTRKLSDVDTAALAVTQTGTVASAPAA